MRIFAAPAGRIQSEMTYNIHVAPNKHGFLVMGKKIGHDVEEQRVYRTVDDLMRAFRDSGIDSETLKHLRRHLEDGKEYSIPNAELAPDTVTHIFGA
jgi:hypothetical protein